MSATPQTLAKQAGPAAWRKNRDRIDGMSLGIEMAGSIVLGWYLGKLFDDHFLTGPWGMAFFLLAGLIAAGKAVMRFYRQAKKVMAAKEPGTLVAAEMDEIERRKAVSASASHTEVTP